MNLINSLSIKALQAPIGSCCTPSLAAAVSNSGGLGALALTWNTPSNILTLIEQTKKLTSKAFQVNFVLSFPIVEQMSAAIEAGAPVVTFSWGLPTYEMVKRLHKAAIPFGIQIFSYAEAKAAEELGATFLITQGIEAGGHVQGTLPIIEQIQRLKSQYLKLPLVAAGGVGTLENAIKVRSAGADAIMLGTRFVASKESFAHQHYKELLVSSSAKDTVLTTCFSHGWPNAAHRVLRNNILTSWENGEKLPSISGAYAPNDFPIPVLSDMPPLSNTKGDIRNMCLYAGTSVESISKISSASEIMEEFSML